MSVAQYTTVKKFVEFTGYVEHFESWSSRSGLIPIYNRNINNTCPDKFSELQTRHRRLRICLMATACIIMFLLLKTIRVSEHLNRRAGGSTVENLIREQNVLLGLVPFYILGMIPECLSFIVDLHNRTGG